MTKSLFGCMALLCGVAANLHAALHFEDKVILVKPSLGEESAKAEFRFTNTGDGTIEVLEIKPSCGCTTATLDKKIYEPKESGTIVAKLAIGDLAGFYSKSISVTTSEKTGNIYLLTLNAEIPEYFSINHRLLFWNASEKLDSKVVEIVYGKSRAMHLVSATDSSGKFKAQIEESADHAKATVAVTPLAADFQQGEITLTFQTAGGKITKAVIFMRRLPSASVADPLRRSGS